LPPGILKKEYAQEGQSLLLHEIRCILQGEGRGPGFPFAVYCFKLVS